MDDRRAVAVEEVAAALSHAAHTRATMPDYTVTRVALDEQDGEEVWWVQPVRPGAHPGDCRQAIRDPNVFWCAPAPCDLAPPRARARPLTAP